MLSYVGDQSRNSLWDRLCSNDSWRSRPMLNNH